ncbi:MAG: histidyl-tRNA synthetase [Sphingobacteriales bacterium]
MEKIPATLPKGTRDFSPAVMAGRNFIFDTIKSVFRKYGFQQIETPSLENLRTLTGKYGDEGDKLIFKILNSGEYLNKVDDKAFAEKNITAITPKISEKALRYDLTIPFARYVVQHRNDITFPFKRFQIQPVWRADRPQKGRYREFYQCDADVIGTDSLLCEAELAAIYDEALSKLGLEDYTIRLNNRKILGGLIEVAGMGDRFSEVTIAIDKLDKIGSDGVKKELLEKGFRESDIDTLMMAFTVSGSVFDKLEWLQSHLKSSEQGMKGVEEMITVFDYLKNFGQFEGEVTLDFTLARGLDYYTGTIYEVAVNDVKIGSIGGGGRYDNLTEVFGLKDVTGVGISFGADRIYDVLEEKGLLKNKIAVSTQIFICNFDKAAHNISLSLMARLRREGRSVEMYPDVAKVKKNLMYANSNNIPFVIMIGDEELKQNKFTLKNMITGDQDLCSLEEVIAKTNS